MDKKPDILHEAKRLRLLAAALELQHYTSTAANVVPIPGGDRVITIGTPTQVRALLPGTTAVQPLDLDKLSADIMNLPCKMGRAIAMNAASAQVYKEGHRDARHAAAELVNEQAAQARTAQPAGAADATVSASIDTPEFRALLRDCGYNFGRTDEAKREAEAKVIAYIDSRATQPVQAGEAAPGKIVITLRQAHQLVKFFGGHDTSVTVMPPESGWEQQMPGLYAYCTEYPEDGCEYLGPTEVDDDLARLGESGKAARATLTPVAAPAQIDEGVMLNLSRELIAALKRLSFAAQTTGGTAGPDAELQAAIAQGERALSLGAVARAMNASEAAPVAAQQAQVPAFTFNTEKGLVPKVAAQQADWLKEELRTTNERIAAAKAPALYVRLADIDGTMPGSTVVASKVATEEWSVPFQAAAKAPAAQAVDEAEFDSAQLLDIARDLEELHTSAVMAGEEVDAQTRNLDLEFARNTMVSAKFALREYANFLAASPASTPEASQKADDEWDRNAERLTREMGIGGGRINPDATSIDNLFIDDEDDKQAAAVAAPSEQGAVVREVPAAWESQLSRDFFCKWMLRKHNDAEQAMMDELAKWRTLAAPAVAATTSEDARSDVRLVLDEVERATRKFPTWPTDPLHAVAVLGEEFGELTKAVLQTAYEPHKVKEGELHTEAIQTAAMALRFVASLDRYEFRQCAQHEQPAMRATQQEGGNA